MRHYDAIGLLPSDVDPRSGYRHYGARDLQRGVRIEQLKAAGLELATIRAILDGALPLGPALETQRTRVAEEVSVARQRLAVIDALAGAMSTLGNPRVVNVPVGGAGGVYATCDVDTVATTIRRCVQRLRRHVPRSSVFRAEIPLDLGDGPFDVGVRTETSGETSTEVSRAVAVAMVGPIGLIPLAYDAALAEVERLDLSPSGTVVERYHDLSVSPHVEVAVLIAE